MKKSLVLLASVLVLTACGESTHKEEHVGITTEEQVKEKYTDLAKEIIKGFDDKVKVDIEDEVITSDIEEFHTEINIIVTDKEYRNKIIEAEKNEDNEYLLDIQKQVKKYSEKLSNDIDSISFVYIDKDGNNNTLAYFQKNNDIIPMIEIDDEETTSDKSVSKKSKKEKYSKKNSIDTNNL